MRVTEMFSISSISSHDKTCCYTLRCYFYQVLRYWAWQAD